MDSRSKASLIIIVTGDAASGKSTFCRKVSQLLHFPCDIINVGELLAARLLEDDKVRPRFKAQLGPLFLERYGAPAIGTAVRDAVAAALDDSVDTVIVDGIRLRSTYTALLRFAAERDCCVVHAHLN